MPEATPDPAPISVEEHLARILDAVTPLPAVEVPLLDALGLVAADTVHSALDLPSFDNSAMDGYAVRAADLAGATAETPVVLPVVGAIGAGSERTATVEPGTAVKIMTGAPMPPGADAVVPYEWTDHGAEQVSVTQVPETGAHVRGAGGDVTSGDLLLEPGTRLTSRHLGLLAAVGLPTVRVHPRPRVVVLSTGAELRDPGTELGADSIHDSNSYLLAAAALETGVEVVRVGAVDDDVDGFWPTLEGLLDGADAVVTTGGVSMGDYDVVKAALRPLGTVWFGPVAMQPGKPQGFGTVGERGVPIFTLPGNPVSAYLSFELFVKPALRRMMGREDQRTVTRMATVTEDLRSPAGRRQMLRGRLAETADGATVTPVGGAGSHLVGFLAHADALIVVPEDVTSVAAGTEVEVVPLVTDPVAGRQVAP